MELVYILIGILIGVVTGWIFRGANIARREARAFQLGMETAKKIFLGLVGMKEDNNEQNNS